MVALERHAAALLAAMLVTLSLMVQCHAAKAQAVACAQLEPRNQIEKQIKRALTTRDLVTLRDIGTVYPVLKDPMFSVSPDHRRVALQIRQADPDGNMYCLGVYIVNLDDSHSLSVVDNGGEIILDSSDQLGRADFRVGSPKTITPKWAPDGKWIAYLKRLGGTTQVWRSFLDGSPSRQITRSLSDIEDFRITPDGQSIVYSVRAALNEEIASINDESRRGYHFDTRVFPSTGLRPHPPAIGNTEFYATDLVSGRVTPSTEQELKSPAPPAQLGRAFWRPLADLSFPAHHRLTFGDADGRNIDCPSTVCVGSPSLSWVDSGGRTVLFVRREGWGDEDSAVYRWNIVNGSVKRIYRTHDQLYDCASVPTGSLCVVEGSTKPRRIVQFTKQFDRCWTVLDLNPELRNLRLGHVERLRWHNNGGQEFFGDLVYPTDYRQGTRYPLVIAQYTSRGFLRGGTGDELPIQALANDGFAVLSVQRPNPLKLAPGATDAYAVDRAILRGFADRRSVLDGIEIAIEHLVERGVISRSQVGIWGLSDGSSTVQFAALHSKMFSAGSVSGCCWDPVQDFLLGPAIAQHFHRSGWPAFPSYQSGFWSEISLSSRAGDVRFPLLMQMADEEYLISLPAITALRNAGKPADLFLFPDEYHFKWQPAHRQAVYDRNVAWFEYWLKHIIPADGPFAPEVRRWAEMDRGH